MGGSRPSPSRRSAGCRCDPTIRPSSRGRGWSGTSTGSRCPTARWNWPGPTRRHRPSGCVATWACSSIPRRTGPCSSRGWRTTWISSVAAGLDAERLLADADRHRDDATGPGPASGHPVSPKRERVLVCRPAVPGRPGARSSRGSDVNDAAAAGELLHAPLVIEYRFMRTTGPVIGAFLTGLRDRRVLRHPRGRRSGRVPAGRVRPHHGRTPDRDGRGGLRGHGHLVDAGSPRPATASPWTARTRWRWCSSTAPTRPMLHAVDAPGPDAVSTGARVRIRWADERDGQITDIACFELDRRCRMSRGRPQHLDAARRALVPAPAQHPRPGGPTTTNRCSASASPRP